MSRVLTVKDSIFADRKESEINLWNSVIHYCGPIYPDNPQCYVHNGSTTVTLVRATAGLEFTADSTNVAVGSTVKFKNRIVNPSVSGVNLPKQILRYVWTPDDTSRGGNATEVVDSSSAACTTQVGDSTCTRVINGSGTLRIVARVNGKTTEERVRVNAIPCPTGDPILDHKEIRTALKQMWQLSNADSTPGAGRDSVSCRDAQGNPKTCGFKREQAQWIFKRADSSYFAVPVISSYQDPCTISLPPAPDPPESGSRLVGVAHSHPSKKGEKLYCKSLDQQGRPVDLYPGDPIGKSTAEKGNDYSRGGGSDKDWSQAQSSPNIDVYVMNKNDEIHRLPAYTPKGDELNNRQQRRKYWRGNKAACPF